MQLSLKSPITARLWLDVSLLLRNHRPRWSLNLDIFEYLNFVFRHYFRVSVNFLLIRYICFYSIHFSCVYNSLSFVFFAFTLSPFLSNASNPIIPPLFPETPPLSICQQALSADPWRKPMLWLGTQLTNNIMFTLRCTCLQLISQLVMWPLSSLGTNTPLLLVLCQMLFPSP